MMINSSSTTPDVLLDDTTSSNSLQPHQPIAHPSSADAADQIPHTLAVAQARSDLLEYACDILIAIQFAIGKTPLPISEDVDSLKQFDGIASYVSDLRSRHSALLSTTNIRPGDLFANESWTILTNNKSYNDLAPKLLNASAEVKLGLAPELYPSNACKMTAAAGLIPDCVSATLPATWYVIFRYAPVPLPLIRVLIWNHFEKQWRQANKEHRHTVALGERQARLTAMRLVHEQLIGSLLVRFKTSLDFASAEEMDDREFGKYFLPICYHMKELTRFLDLMQGFCLFKYTCAGVYDYSKQSHHFPGRSLQQKSRLEGIRPAAPLRNKNSGEHNNNNNTSDDDSEISDDEMRQDCSEFKKRGSNNSNKNKNRKMRRKKRSRRRSKKKNSHDKVLVSSDDARRRPSSSGVAEPSISNTVHANQVLVGDNDEHSLSAPEELPAHFNNNEDHSESSSEVEVECNSHNGESSSVYDGSDAGSTEADRDPDDNNNSDDDYDDSYIDNSEDENIKSSSSNKYYRNSSSSSKQKRQQQNQTQQQQQQQQQQRRSTSVVPSSAKSESAFANNRLATVDDDSLESIRGLFADETKQNNNDNDNSNNNNNKKKVRSPPSAAAENDDDDSNNNNNNSNKNRSRRNRYKLGRSNAAQQNENNNNNNTGGGVQQQQQQSHDDEKEDSAVDNKRIIEEDVDDDDKLTPSNIAFRGSSLKFRRSQTKYASDEQLATLPYHSKMVKRYNMKTILSRANSKTRARLQEVMKDIDRPFGDDLKRCPPVRVPKSMSVKKHHTDQRLQHQTIRKVSQEDEKRYPSRGTVQEFCVVERKKKVDASTKEEIIFDRLRQIDHPIKQNEALRSRNFKTTAPLKHFSHYHRRILHKKALIADLEASFYGYELEDPVARSFYRFRDETGQLYELSVLMMGLVASVELQQIITSIIAGHQDYVLPKFAAPTLPEIWVDNIRFCGDEKILKKCDSFLRQSMNDCNASLDIEGISSEYDFLGATWNHINKTVELAKKNRLKLPDVLPAKMTARELEGLIGRLIFVAQIMQDPLVNHYWLLKWARRFFNGLNTGRITPDQEISIPPSAAASLSRWLEAAKRPHKVRFSNAGRSRATLFTDASLGGWGAVLVLADGSIHIAGGKLTEKDHQNNINIAESLALEKSLSSFSSLISSLSISILDILVDNTSVEYNVRRGMPRADDLAIHIKNIWSKIFSLNISVSINRVSTEKNPADSISRGKSLEFSKLQQALGDIQTNNNTTNTRLGSTGADLDTAPVADKHTVVS